LFRQGVFVSLTNPKSLLAYAALLPQFADPARPVVPQFSLLALTAAGIAVAVYAGYSALAGGLARFVKSERRRRFVARSAAVVYLAGAVILAAARPT
jgi:homoserine/homoserine lactone efflux protein